MRIERLILKLSGYLWELFVIWIVGTPVLFLNDLKSFEILLVLVAASVLWPLTWEGYLLGSEGKTTPGALLGGIGVRDGGRNIAARRVLIDMMDGEEPLVEVEAFKKMTLGYSLGKLTITNLRIYFVPRDPIFHGKSRMALLRRDVGKLEILNGRKPQSMRKLVVDGELFLVNSDFEIPSTNKAG